MIETSVRCFRGLQNELCTTRRGIWLMTGPRRGIFFHGDREEVQSPTYDLKELDEWAHSEKDDDMFYVQEIPPEGALAELASWPEARDEAIGIFQRHPLKAKA